MDDVSKQEVEEYEAINAIFGMNQKYKAWHVLSQDVSSVLSPGRRLCTSTEPHLGLRATTFKFFPFIFQFML